MDANFVSSLRKVIFVLLVRDIHGLFRISGPDKVLNSTRIIPSYQSFPTRSLLICYAACVQETLLCESFSYHSNSSSCGLVQTGTGASITEELNWVSVVVSQQATTDSTTVETTLPPTTTTTTVPSTTTTIPTTTPFACPIGFVSYTNKCYFIEPHTQRSIADAENECGAKSAELLSIETEEEQTFIHSTLNGQGFSNDFWTSGRGTGSGSYVWVSSSQSVVYENFDTGYPGGDYGSDTCIYLQGPSTYKWRPRSCTTGVNRYICEYPITT